MLESEREDRPYSREGLLALEQTRGFSYTPGVPSRELMQGSTQVLPSYEEMTIDELFNGPSSMETQPDLEQVQVLDEGIAVINGAHGCKSTSWKRPNLSTPTLSYQINDWPCAIPAPCTLEVLRTNRTS